MSPDERLAAALARWRLSDATCRPLAGDVGLRRYLRVQPADGGESVVAMVAPESERGKFADWLAIGRWLAERGVVVPRVRRRCDELLVLLIDDAGDTLLTDVADPWPGQREAIETLARLERLAATEAPDLTPAHGRTLTEERLRWELRRFRKVVCSPVEPLGAGELALWKAAEDALTAGLLVAPRAWMHRDLHARNLLVDSERLVWIDFQDAMQGPWLYDLASLALDPYAALDEPARRRVVEHYLALPDRVHRHVAPAAVERLWRLVACQRLIHCVACYVWVNDQAGRPTYLRYLPTALARLRETVAACPEAEGLAAVLDRRWERIALRWCGHAVGG